MSSHRSDDKAKKSKSKTKSKASSRSASSSSSSRSSSSRSSSSSSAKKKAQGTDGDGSHAPPKRSKSRERGGGFFHKEREEARAAAKIAEEAARVKAQEEARKAALEEQNDARMAKVMLRAREDPRVLIGYVLRLLDTGWNAPKTMLERDAIAVRCVKPSMFSLDRCPRHVLRYPDTNEEVTVILERNLQPTDGSKRSAATRWGLGGAS